MYLRQHYNTKETPQGQAIPGSTQVPNSAGGYAWAVDDWTRLDRFLVLGSEGGTYYIGEQKLTVENAEAVRRCIVSDGPRVVERIVAISEAGRAPKNDPALFALAMCVSFGDLETRRRAFSALPRVARIGTHLFHFANYVDGLRGWGRGLRRAVASWYQDMEPTQLSFQAIKYQQRDGWGHRDLLRLSHPKAQDSRHNAIYKWIVDGELVGFGEAMDQIQAFAQAQVSEGKELANLITEFRLPMEAVPSGKRTKEVWEAALPHLGLTALIRNLGVMTSLGVLAKGQWAANTQVIARLTDPKQLKTARIHPIAVLSALITYNQGRGVRGHKTWETVPDIVDALDHAFYLAFDNIEPTGKRLVLALDVSSSMARCGDIAGVPGLTPRVGAAAMAMVTYKTEGQVALISFQDRIVPLDISRCQRLMDVVVATSGLPFGRTDCAQPMLWALENKVAADAFIIYTDSETWAGSIHPVQALQQYRRETGIPAKLVVVGMVSNGFSIADPDDGGMLDVVGMDTSVPQVIDDFVKG